MFFKEQKKIFIGIKISMERQYVMFKRYALIRKKDILKGK